MSNILWESIESYGDIPTSVYNEINILFGASEEFMDVVSTLEKLDFAERAKVAYDIIEEEDGMKEISFVQLGKYLKNPDCVDLSTWRKLYLLERSIKPQTDSIGRMSWVSRLKMFYNTYLDEYAVLGARYKGNKLYFVKGPKGDERHDALHHGHGQDLADFYYFDDSIQSDKTWQKMVKVDLKYCVSGDIDAAAKYYKTHHNHKASGIILHKKGEGYFMVDYRPAEYTIEKMEGIVEPTGMFEL